MKQPSLNEIINNLKSVLLGDKTREEVSDWASCYVMTDNPTIDNEDVWDLLKTICGIDILDSPTSYLHNEDDINSWIKKASALLK
jgi:hypothetical protein